MFYFSITGDRHLGGVTQDVLGALLLIYVLFNHKKIFCLLALHMQEQALKSCWGKILISVIDFVYSFF